MPELQIDKLAFGGAGFGRLAGKACFVPYTAPGDLVEVRLEKCKSSYAEGVVARLLRSSPCRTIPVCPVFGICGGCNWQHVSYAEQCAQKETIFSDLLWRSARIEHNKIQPVLAAAAPYGYRQRIQLKVDFSAGRRLLGFYQRASHAVIDIHDHCAIAAPSLNAVIENIRELITTSKQSAQIVQVDLAAAANASVSAVFHYSGNLPEALSEHLAQADLRGSGLHSVNMQIGAHKTFRHIRGIEKLIYSVPAADGKDMDLFYGTDSFSQVNFAQNRVMVQLLLDYCRTISPAAIVDFYCGNGNFSLPLAGMVETVLGYESAKKSVSLAEYNATVNGVAHTRYICKDSVAGVLDLAKTPGRFELVIMDPPRSGAEHLSREVHKTGASYIIYISCDPPTLGRDLAILQRTGYEVIAIQPVDMFPQTYHLESVTFLKAV